MAPPTTTVRIGQEEHAIARGLFQETGLSVREIVERAVNTYNGHWIIDQSNQAFERMQREDPDGWAAYQGEGQLWQDAGADTLAAEPPYPVPEEYRRRAPEHGEQR